MLYTREGYPQINELIKCKVTKISKNTTFVQIEEYDKEGVLIISEVSPGRIRSLNEFVSVGREIICKVIRVDEKFNRIDVSLRRVSLFQKKEKQEEIKKEEFCEKVYTDLAKELNSTIDDLFEKTYEVIFDKFESVFECFYEIMLGNEKIDIFKNLNEGEREWFLKIINSKIKPEYIETKQILSLSCIQEDGILKVKETLKDTLKKFEDKDISIKYVSAGKFELLLKSNDKKSSENLLTSFKETLELNSKKNLCMFKFN